MKLDSVEIARLRADAKASGSPEPGHASVSIENDASLPLAEVGGSPIVDTSNGLSRDFGFDVQYLGSTVLPSEPAAVAVHLDACFLEWAKTTLAASNGLSGTHAETVCGRDAAVIIGGYGVEGRDLIGRAVDGFGTSPTAPILFGHEALAYASAATSDGKGIIIVVGTPE
ncbi:hypothetical protein [Glaciihabitans sp. INWT7]|uniref:hypothetical protein n=1 Tax=Glaciihabitans sp. INWT7 TaxID=2596912 RepID=UPI001624EC19|nr:hypothetical protein [Glaciihabitans sp. INWT7]